MTDQEMLQGTFWPVLNPYYTADPTAPPVPQTSPGSVNSIDSREVTAEWLVKEAINRGVDRIPGLLWYSKDEDGIYTAEAYVHTKDGNREYQIVKVSI